MHDTHVSFTIQDKKFQALLALASSKDTSMAKIIREALDAYLIANQPKVEEEIEDNIIPIEAKQKPMKKAAKKKKK
jgi:hypothetical protein